MLGAERATSDDIAQAMQVRAEVAEIYGESFDDLTGHEQSLICVGYRAALARRATAGTTAAPGPDGLKLAGWFAYKDKAWRAAWPSTPNAAPLYLIAGNAAQVFRSEDGREITKVGDEYFGDSGGNGTIFRRVAGNAAPTEAGDQVMRALKDACDLAMRNTLAARIPECGDFGSIAQNLSWAIDQLATSAAAPGDLPPLPEMLGVSDLPAYVMATPPDWDDDYRATWQKLQVAERNKAQWRAYALDLRSRLAGNAGAAPGVPEGFRLVPEQLTPEMQRAYFAVIDKNLNAVQTKATFGRWDSAREAYRAMIAVAPAAPSDTSPVGAKEKE